MNEKKQLDPTEIRAYLVHELCAAREQLTAAQRRMEEATQQLRSYDAIVQAASLAAQGFPSRPAPELHKETEVIEKAYVKGRTLAVRTAITTFEGSPFTPAQLRDRILERQPEAAYLFEDTTSVTKVLNKLLTTDPDFLHRNTKGAGVKEPVYSQLPTTT